MSYIQIPGHYQAVPETETESFDTEKALDIKTLLHILYSSDPFLKKTQGYIAPSDELNQEWGKVHLLKSFQDFPTIAPDHYGAIIEFKGKTFHVYYEEQDCLVIGHGDTLRAFRNKEGIEDCIDVFNFVFEPVCHEIDEISVDNIDKIAKLCL